MLITVAMLAFSVRIVSRIAILGRIMGAQPAHCTLDVAKILPPDTHDPWQEGGAARHVHIKDITTGRRPDEQNSPSPSNGFGKE